MEIRLHKEIAASAEDVWGVVGEEFGDLTWTAGVTESDLEGDLGVGVVRVCRFPPNMFSDAGEIRERLIAFDREARALSYEATDLSRGVMSRAVNRWSITSLAPGRCRVDMHATAELRGFARLLTPIMAVLLRRMGAKTLTELANHVAARRGLNTRPAA